MARAKVARPKVKRRRRPDVEFDLEHVRHIKRLARRVVKQLTLMESFLIKQKKKWDAKVTPEEAAAYKEALGPRKTAAERAEMTPEELDNYFGDDREEQD